MSAAPLLRPRVILAALVVALMVAILITPEPAVSGDQRLTTYSAAPFAARGLYDVAARLGWPVRRQDTPLPVALDSDAVYAELGGPVPLSLREAHALLDAVRRGAGLVYVLGEGGPLDDSIPFTRGVGGALTALAWGDTLPCPRQALPLTIFWFAEGVNLYGLTARRPLPPDTAVFLSVRGPTGARPVVPATVGYPLGRGRVLVISDPDVLRNDVVRRCRWGIGVRVIDGLTWVSAGRRPPLIFDEYHQGFGAHAGLPRAVWAFLTDIPLGHTIIQWAVGGLVLVLALGVRAIPPRSVPRIERRSPLEHVDALARAYEQIHGTRTAARRLARGLRRRHERGGWRAQGRAPAGPDVSAIGTAIGTEAVPAGGVTAAGHVDEADARFLEAVAAAHPEVAADARRVILAERRAVSPAELLAVADAVDRIDAVFPGGSGTHAATTGRQDLPSPDEGMP